MLGIDEKNHCDTVADDPSQPECLRKYLNYGRLPASCKLAGVPQDKVEMMRPYIPDEHKPYIWTDPEPVLFADFEGKHVRVVMASRFGDVGITENLSASHGYSKRVQVGQLSNFSDALAAA